MEEIIVRYDGESLAEHSMNLKLVAESLSGLEALVREVHDELGGKEEELALHVKGGFSKGSFEFLIGVEQVLHNNIDLLKIIGFGAPAATGTLVSYLKWLKGRKIQKITLNEQGNCKITTEDGDSKESPSYMRPLLASNSVRTAFSKIISKPLRRGGIELFETQSTENNKGERTSFVSITDDEETYFRQKNVTVIDISDTKPLDEKVITFLSVHKDKDTGWRIDYDGEALTVKMEDDMFLTKFRKGGEPDIFSNAYTVEINEIENTITLDKSYSIVKVYAPE